MQEEKAKIRAEPQCAYPSTAQQSDEKVLSQEQINQWRNKGFVLVDGVIPEEIIKKTREESLDVLTKLAKYTDFGSNGKLEFPTESSTINSVTLHPRLLNAVSQLLGEDDILLVQSDIWKKHGVDLSKINEENGLGREMLNYDQRIHMDYPNHYLTHPPIWSKVEAVEIIIYYSDSDDTEGNTRLVPREGEEDEAYSYPYKNMPGFGDQIWMNDKTCVENHYQKTNKEIYDFRQKLYNREQKACFKPGTVLFYRYDVWHRGTPLKPGALRIVQNMAFRSKTKTENWITNWNAGWAKSMYTPQQVVEKLIAQSSVRQRSVLGFPEPGSSYWTKETLDAVQQRYGPFGFDISPYKI